MLQSELERFIAEDLGPEDDSSAIIPEVFAEAKIIAKEDCVISGLAEAGEILDYFGLEHSSCLKDGQIVPCGTAVLTIRGNARRILQSERLVLNFMARMSGISTLTRECVLRAGGVRVACTRKTTPGFRAFEKKAVFLGGGDPHRFNLSGAVLIKDNHIKILGLEGSINAARQRASFSKKIEAEVEDLESMRLAAKLGVDIIMFDNMDPSEIERGVKILTEMGLRQSVILEASGTITPENIQAYAGSGVDVISMGSLTRNARWTDLSLDVELVRRETDLGCDS
jgi:nicotinate-nucleotide pyrophosphorylase (carboxylating)